MPTTVSKHIGLGTGNGYDFSGANCIQNWIASLNGLDLIGPDQIQQGLLHFNGTGDGEFTAAGMVADFAAVSVTTNATHYVELTTATGQSFRDAPGNPPLFYDATKGAALRNTGSSGNTIRTAGNVPDVRISNIQVKSDAGSSGVVQWSANQSDIWNNCIIQGFEALINGGLPTLNNCALILTNGTSGRFINHIGTSLVCNDCTIVVPSGVTVAHIVDYNNGTSAVSATYRNTLFFGSTTDYAYRAGTSVIVYQTCASNLAATTGVVGGLTYANQFVNITNNFRQNPTLSNLVGQGTTVSGITTDIYGVARKSPPDIGATELAAAAAPSRGFVKFGPFLGIAAAEEWLRRRKEQVRRDEG